MAVGRIFINYRRDDTRGAAGRLTDSLQAYFGDDRVFRDVESLVGGSAFDEVLASTLGSADCVIVLIGRDWLTLRDDGGRRRLDDPDDWVSREIALALESRVPIYPVLVEGASMPRAEDLPEGLRPLVRHHAVSVSDERWHDDVQRLARIMAIDMPGSVAERRVARVRLAVTLPLVAGVVLTTGVLVWNLVRLVEADSGSLTHADQVLSQAMSGITFVAIMFGSIVLLVYGPWIHESRRRYCYAAGLLGVVGTAVCYVLWRPVPEELETLVNYLGSTAIATGMLVLTNLCGFKAR